MSLAIPDPTRDAINSMLDDAQSDVRKCFTGDPRTLFDAFDSLCNAVRKLTETLGS